MHARQQIREAAATVLAGATPYPVYQSRIWPLAADKLPCLLLFTRREQSSRLTMGSRSARKLARVCELLVEGIVAASEATMDDQLDEIARGVEAAIGASETFDGLVHGLVLASTLSEMRAREGEKPVGAVQLVYEVQYHTTETDPATIVN
jgi:hypothetical protein